MKKITAILTSIILSISISANSSAYAALADSNNVDEEVFEISRQIYQIEQAMALQEDALNACALFDSNLSVDEKGQPIYPDSYAGRYIDDNGHLIIQIASSDFNSYEYLRDKYPIVEFKIVEHSTKYLEELVEEFLNTIDRNKEKFFSIYVDTKLNQVVVEVDEETFCLKSKSKSKSELPITYKIGSASDFMSKTITSGDTLYNKNSKSSFSAGFGVLYESNEAILSCGHGMKEGDKIYSGLTHIGTVSFAAFSEGDYSIITMNGKNTINDKLYVGDSEYENNGIVNSLSNGALVVKQTKNGGYAAFKIAETDVTINGDFEGTNVTISGLTRAERILGAVLLGDSGGGLYNKYSDGKYHFYGILSAWGENAAMLYITPVWWIIFKSNGAIRIK